MGRGKTSLSEGQSRSGALGFVRTPDNGLIDRIAELARFLLNGDAGIVDLGDSSGADGFGASVVPGDAAAPVVGSGAALERMADPLTALKLGFASQASVPIRMGRDRIGTLAVLTRAARTFDAHDVETLRRLAELVAECAAPDLSDIGRQASR